MIETANDKGYAAIKGGLTNSLGTQLRFRPLRADEVDVRLAEAKDGRKATLILYQNARSAMTILDSTLGPTAWQREYYEAAGLLFCKIGIFNSDTNQWLWKSDTGSKSNIEEDKGLASDAFKRAAVAWGIGRELYTAPRISVELNEKDMFNGKVCQSFRVGEMEVNEGVITKLTILDRWGKTRYSFPQSFTIEPPKAEPSFSSTSTTTSHASENEEILLRFYEEKRTTVFGEEKERLESFKAFYLKPDRDFPDRSIISTKNPLDIESLWHWWLVKGKHFKK